MDRDTAETETLIIMARALVGKAKSDEARRLLQSASTHSTAAPALHLELASIELESGNGAGARRHLDAVTRSDPDNEDAARLRIQLRLAEEAQQEAVAEAAILAERHPDDPAALAALGLAHQQAGAAEDAVAAYRQALAKDPGMVEAALNLSKLQEDTGQPGAALDTVERLLRVKPDNVLALTRAWQLESALTDGEPSLDRLERGLRSSPGNNDLRALLATEYIKRHRLGDVAALVETTPGGIANDPNLLWLKAQVEIASERPFNARPSLEALTDLRPNWPTGHYLLARVLASSSGGAPMTEHLLRAFELDPDHPQAGAALLEVSEAMETEQAREQLFGRLERTAPNNIHVTQTKVSQALMVADYDKAVEIAEEAHRRLPNDRDRTFLLAQVQLKGQQVQNAIDTMTGWLAVHRNDVEAMMVLAGLELRVDDAAAAVDLYRRILALTPDNAVALNDLAWLLRETEPGQARRYSEEAVRLVPENAAFLDTLGTILLNAGEAGKAQETLAAAMQIEPTNPSVGFHYAQALASTGRVAEARVILLAIQSKDFPEQEAAKELLDRLSR
jgi:putative PEP-CTERM system TPR-repeat lipoprotein